MIKLKTFHDHEEYCLTPKGASYIKGTFAVDEAEKFINQPNIKVIDLKYSATKGRDVSILVMYKEIK